MKKIINDKYTIYSRAYGYKNLMMIENTETGHWMIGDLLEIGLVFRSDSYQANLFVDYDPKFKPPYGSLQFDTIRGEFYIQSAQMNQYIGDEKYREMIEKFNEVNKENT